MGQHFNKQSPNSFKCHQSMQECAKICHLNAPENVNDSKVWAKCPCLIHRQFSSSLLQLMLPHKWAQISSTYGPLMLSKSRRKCHGTCSQRCQVCNVWSSFPSKSSQTPNDSLSKHNCPQRKCPWNKASKSLKHHILQNNKFLSKRFARSLSKAPSSSSLGWPTCHTS